MNESLRENIIFAWHKKEAARKLSDISYNEAAALYCEDNSGRASVNDAAELFHEMTDSSLSHDGISTEFAHFCREFAAVVKLNFDDDHDETTSDISPRIAYLRNSFSDKAYNAFSKSFRFVTAVYFSGFEEPCEEVYYERCSHAMIPVYNSHDGILMSLYKLLLKYDLKIVSACNIGMGDESAMRYALTAKSLPAGMDKRYVDLSVVLSDSKNIGALLHSLEILGAVTVLINSFPLDYTDERRGLIMQLDMKSASTDALRLFLEGSRVSHDIIGNYDIL